MADDERSGRTNDDMLKPAPGWGSLPGKVITSGMARKETFTAKMTVPFSHVRAVSLRYQIVRNRPYQKDKTLPFCQELIEEMSPSAHRYYTIRANIFEFL